MYEILYEVMQRTGSDITSCHYKEGYIEEDSMLMLPLLECASEISKVNLPLYFWTENPNSVIRVSFNYKRFVFIQVSYERVCFFEHRNDEHLSKLFRREFMNRYVAFGLKAERTGLEKEFNVYRMLYKKKFFKYVLASDLCKMKILMHTLFFLHIPHYK